MPENEFSLTGKTALVTGGSKGIGRSIALTFARAGADVAIAARGKENLGTVKSEIEKTGRRCVAVSADVSSDAEIKNLHRTVSSELGPIDILVNNAGMAHIVALSDMSYDQYHDVFQLNTWAAVHLSQLCYPTMKKKGKGIIINIASTGGIKPDILAGAYSASKSALIMFTKQMACEWGNDGIRCVAICPGLVRTDLSNDLVAHREVNGFHNLVNRAGEPDEIAGMALMLASDAGSYCQGAVYLIDGGSSVSSIW